MYNFERNFEEKHLIAKSIFQAGKGLLCGFYGKLAVLYWHHIRVCILAGVILYPISCMEASYTSRSYAYTMSIRLLATPGATINLVQILTFT